MRESVRARLLVTVQWIADDHPLLWHGPEKPIPLFQQSDITSTLLDALLPVFTPVATVSAFPEHFRHVGASSSERFFEELKRISRTRHVEIEYL